MAVPEVADVYRVGPGKRLLIIEGSSDCGVGLELSVVVDGVPPLSVPVVVTGVHPLNKELKKPQVDVEQSPSSSPSPSQSSRGRICAWVGTAGATVKPDENESPRSASDRAVIWEFVSRRVLVALNEISGRRRP